MITDNEQKGTLRLDRESIEKEMMRYYVEPFLHLKPVLKNDNINPTKK